MDIRTCPHCGGINWFFLGDPPGTLTVCTSCRKFWFPATEITKKPFAETSAGERMRVAVEVAGLKDSSYQTVAHGYVQRYEGRGRVRFADGLYEAVGYGPEGDAWFVYRQGGVKWRKVEQP